MEQRSSEQPPIRRSSNTARSNTITSSHIEASVTRLLVATKALLEGLVKWSKLEVSENDISRIYVQLGNDFNVACGAFAREKISMSDLLSVPEDLRTCLENCLSEAASRRALDTHLPAIRSIIVTLLSGLKTKQAEFRRNTADRMENDRRDAEGSSVQRGVSVNSGNGSSRSIPSSSGTSRNPSSYSTNSDEGRITPTSAHRSREDLRKFVSSTQGNGSDSGSTPRGNPTLPYLPPLPPTPSSMPSYQSTYSNFGASEGERDGRREIEDSHLLSSSTPARGPSSRTRKTSLGRRTVSAEESTTLPVPPISRSGSYTSIPEVPSVTRSERPPTSLAGEGNEEDITLTLSSNKRASTSSTTSSQRRALSSPPPPPILREIPEAVPRTRLGDDLSAGDVSQEQQAIIAVLKSSDNLSRRASKRFSAYTSNQILTSGSEKRSPSKIDGSAGRELSLGLNGEEKKVSRRRSRNGEERRPTPKVPPFPSNSSLHAMNFLARSGSTPSLSDQTPTILEEKESDSVIVQPKLVLNGSVTSTTSPISPTYSEAGSNPYPPQRKDRIGSSASILSEPAPEEFPLTVFLQIGSDVKKISLEERPTLSSLRELFIEKFGYNPGTENFPAIYLRDPIVGVQYELEDIEEVKSRSLVSLKIDAMEQVKSHFDLGLNNLATEIKDLKSSFTAMRRNSISASHPIFSSPIPRSPSPVHMRKAPGSIQSITSEFKMRETSPGIDIPIFSTSIPPTSDTIVIPPTSDTVVISSPSPSAAVANSLKAQHLEILDLRQEISVLKQIHSEFTRTTKDLLTTLRLQNSSVQNLASTKMVSTRTFLTAGLEKLDKTAATLIVDGDVVQDAIDDMKRDVAWKKVTPTELSVSSISNSLTNVKIARDELMKWVEAEKMSWKNTWREEIGRVVEEQATIEGVEKTLQDLQEDFDDATATLDQIKLALAVPKSKRKIEFIPIDPESEADSRSAILLGIQASNSEINAAKRLEKIAEMEASRISEKANRTDELAEALGGFLKTTGLKKSGGIEETERKRELKAAAALKAMFAPAPVLSAGPLPTEPLPVLPESTFTSPPPALIED